MKDEAKIEVEVVESLTRLCRTLRSNRARPELAIPAAQWEAKLNARLKEITPQAELRLPKIKKQEVHA